MCVCERERERERERENVCVLRYARDIAQRSTLPGYTAGNAFGKSRLPLLLIDIVIFALLLNAENIT